MNQFALLKQKAREGERANAETLAQLTGALAGPRENRDPVWDVTLEEAEQQFSGEGAAPPAGDTEAERAYHNATSGRKRGDSALLEHLDRRAAQFAKRQRTPAEQRTQGADAKPP